jgi:hypothetical protein
MAHLQSGLKRTLRALERLKDSPSGWSSRQRSQGAWAR